MASLLERSPRARDRPNGRSQALGLRTFTPTYTTVQTSPLPDCDLGRGSHLAWGIPDPTSVGTGGTVPAPIPSMNRRPVASRSGASVSDVLERLKAALSDRYAFEREVGAGGMATVYVAED